MAHGAWTAAVRVRCECRIVKQCMRERERDHKSMSISAASLFPLRFDCQLTRTRSLPTRPLPQLARMWRAGLGSPPQDGTRKRSASSKRQRKAPVRAR